MYECGGLSDRQVNYYYIDFCVEEVKNTCYAIYITLRSNLKCVNFKDKLLSFRNKSSNSVLMI